MKRVVSVIIVLMMILIALAGCGGGDKGAPVSKYVGVWTMTSVDAFGNGQEFTAKELDMSGSLDIKANGTIDLDLDGTKASDKWKEEDGKLVLDSGFVGELKDGRIALEVMGVIFYFSK
ncbi:MAG: hypothetical protein GX245_01890 [Eubacteriaceae bacterium]|jgi:hypothetical protein|nr:hypothetical protein [Eubacteriaceae bacterium]